MKNSLINITEDNINEWLGSLGYFFPTNSFHLNQFEIAYSNYKYILTDNKVDIESIINGNHRKTRPARTIQLDNLNTPIFNNLKMVARKGEEIPEDIIDLMKKNQKDLNRDE
jgi:hypothetical protein